MNKQPVVIVGAGVGGLAAAVDLAQAGLPVRVIERENASGGKISELEVGAAHIDSGPTVLTMKWVFDELFDAAGASFDERVASTRAEVLARHVWADGEQLDLHADPARAADAIGSFAGVKAVRGFEAFRRRAREVYETLEHTFIRGPRPTRLGLVRSAGGVLQLLRIRPFATLWRELGQFFPDARLRQLFARYATYCGSSPFLAPATLMLVAHVELEGVWRVTGGMQRLPEAMAKLAVEKGVEFVHGQTVTDVLVEGGRAAGVALSSGEQVSASAVVLNVDVASIAAGLLGAVAQRTVGSLPRACRSLSALTLSLHQPVHGIQLSRHNVFFGADYHQEFSDLTEQRRLPRAPTVYVCAQDREDGTDDAASSGGKENRPERLFCIINAPAIGDEGPSPQADIDQCTQSGLDLLNRCGLSLTPTVENCRIRSPWDFERRFPGTGGAIYGRATHGSSATFLRPETRTRIPGVYLTGGSVHPGPGVPMATLSGRLAARCLLEDWPSSALSRRVGTPGGTSMR